MLLYGCGDSSDKMANMGTPECPLCGEWETPKGISTNSQLSILPDRFKMDSQWTHRRDCTLISDSWKTTGKEEGFILLKNVIARCNKIKTSNKLKTESYKLQFHLENYTLMVVGKEKEEILYTRIGVEIPEQPNPLIGKWAVLKEGESSGQYKDKWYTLRYKVWFKKASFQVDRTSNYLDKYIVEDDRVYVISKSGKWSVVYPIGPNKIILKPGSLPFRPRSILMMPDLWQRKDLKNKEMVFSRIE
jgi:hypothetical protein